MYQSLDYKQLLPDLIVVAEPEEVFPALIAEIRALDGVRQLRFTEKDKAWFFQLRPDGDRSL